MKVLPLCVLVLLRCVTLCATERRVTEVRFDGDFRIREWLLQNEIEMKRGEIFSPKQWQRDKQRLSSLQIFSDVSSDTSVSDDGVLVDYKLDEEWTLIPLLNLGGEIDNIDIDIGFRDKDFLGLFLEPGFLYSHFEKRDSYEGWLSWPRAFGSKYGASISAAKTHTHEPADLETEDVRYDYDVKRTSIAAAASKRFTETTVAGIGFAYKFERYKIDSFEIAPRALPVYREQRRIQPSASLTFGRVYYDDYFYEGRDISLAGDLIAFDLDDYKFKYWLFSLQGRNYLRIGSRWNLCSRLVFGASKIRDVLPAYAITGLSNVRGAEDRTRRGSKTYYGNSELRFRAIDLKWIHSQLAAFVDFGNAWEKLRAAEVINRSYLTGGVGIRLALRQFNDAIGRADVAYNSNDGTFTLYFSAGQFF